MIDLLTIKPNHIYYLKNNKYRFPLNANDQMHGTVYASVSKNTDTTIQFFNNPAWTVRYLTKYYHDRLYNYRLYTQVMRYRIQDKELNALYDTKVANIMPELYLAYNETTLAGRNYIYDISQLNETFFNRKDSYIGVKRVNEYFRLFKDVLTKVDTSVYINKVLFIPIDEWVTDIKDSNLYTIRKLDNFFSLFYQKLLVDPVYINTLFAGWKVYFIYNGQVFSYDFSNPDKKAAADFKKFLFKLKVPGESHTVQAIGGMVSDEITPEELTKISENLTALRDAVTDKFSTDNIPDVNITNDAVDIIVNKSIEKSNIDLSKTDLTVNTDMIISKKEAEIEQILAIKDSIVPRSAARLAREVKLVEEMGALKLGDMDIDIIRTQAANKTIPKVDIPINSINPNLKTMSFPEFDKVYLDNQYMQDIVRIFTGLQYKDRPLYMISSEVVDKSDKLNKIEEYTFKFEDEKGGRHTFQIVLPKFINNRFLKLSGNKKILINQLLPLPVTKTSPDTVQVASNYKKTFITRFGQDVSPKLIGFVKALAAYTGDKIKLQVGASVKVNSKYIRTIEYDEIANKYRTINMGEYTFYFDQAMIREAIVAKKIDAKDILKPNSTILPICIYKNNVIYLNTDSNNIVGTETDLIDYLLSIADIAEPGFSKPLKGVKSGKKYMYTRATIMAKKVPLVLLLSYLDGLYSLMKKANIEYRIVGKDEVKGKLLFDIGNEEVIEFNDAYLIYKAYPLKSMLLMNGFTEIPTKVYDIAQFLSKDVYYEIFDVLFGRKNIGYAFENFKQLFTDPMTEDVLEDYGLPTDFVELLLYANSLLEDNSYQDEGEMSGYRVRCNEMIVAFLYRVVAEAYENYRLTADNPSPAKFSAKKDAVLIEILTNQVTQDSSELSPQQVLENMRGITYKGPGGLNQDRAFSLSKRAYHPSMIGVLSQASPISGAIGVARTLTIDANVVSTRGYINTSTTKDEINNLPSTKLLSGAEAAAPFSPTSDEPEREAMLSAQTKHTISSIGSQPSLIGTGFEKALPYLIGDNFVYKAKQDGVITKIDTVADAIIVKYDDGTSVAVNMNPEMGRNTGGGFYVSNHLTTNLKTGDRVKANSIIAYDPKYFTIDKRTKDLIFITGPRARIAYVYSSKVFEDSGCMSTSLAKRMASDIVDKKVISLGVNSNIDFMVKKHQAVSVNDPLIIFDTSHTDELTNRILSKMKDENLADILEASKTPVLSKHNGVIEDIKIYYTVPKEELSESVMNIITEYEEDNKKKIKALSADTKLAPEDIDISLVDVEYVKSDTSGKVKGVQLDDGKGIIIEFYVKYRAGMGIGDKYTQNVAIKAVLGNVWKEGDEPYLLSNPDDKIDAYVSLLSVGARLINSVFKTSLMTGVLIGMKPNIKNMYENIYNEKIVEKKNNID